MYMFSFNSIAWLFGHLNATQSFMLHAKQSSGKYLKKRLQSKILKSMEQCIQYI